ncbi:hypothetical protein CMO90_03270 [Candidatus Woesearchaeota archaeon]|jgi:drug/metabolite transporter (DMT)-like permease|nr:hypothetical protein [Candidatus Woesearchaeota archaeon]|tara:strand:+ start:2209 stop:3108 length:900 start_codon:yes stop_codon:yes gene_type:complete
MKKGFLLVLLTAIISGVSIFLNSFGVKGINPFIFTGMKNFIVGMLLLSIILSFKYFNELKNLKRKDWQDLILIGFIGGSIPFLLFFKGLQLINGVQAAFVHKTMVVWVVFLSMFLLKEKLDKKIVFGAMLLLTGNFLMLKLSSFDLSFGLLLVFLATVFWSFEIILSKKVLKRLSGNIVALGRMFFGALFISIFLISTGQISLVLDLGLSQIAWICLTSLFLLGYVMTFYNGLKLVSASSAVAILSLGSVITTILKLVFLDAVVSFSQITGMMLLVVGILVFTVTIENLKKFYSIFSTA